MSAARPWAGTCVPHGWLQMRLNTAMVDSPVGEEFGPSQWMPMPAATSNQ